MSSFIDSITGGYNSNGCFDLTYNLKVDSPDCVQFELPFIVYDLSFALKRKSSYRPILMAQTMKMITSRREIDLTPLLNYYGKDFIVSVSEKDVDCRFFRRNDSKIFHEFGPIDIFGSDIFDYALYMKKILTLGAVGEDIKRIEVRYRTRTAADWAEPKDAQGLEYSLFLQDYGSPDVLNMIKLQSRIEEQSNSLALEDNTIVKFIDYTRLYELCNPNI